MDKSEYRKVRLIPYLIDVMKGNSQQSASQEPVPLTSVISKESEFRALFERPEETIAHESVERWRQWGESDFFFDKRGTKKWEYCDKLRRYAKSPPRSSVFSDLVTRKTNENFECDIQDITGMSNSKSDLTRFTDLDELAETNSQDFITPCSQEKLDENLRWPEIRILRQENSSDWLQRYQWNDRIFLINDGGSHHFAAARYIAKCLKPPVPVPISAKLDTYEINREVLKNLLRKFDLFVINEAENEVEHAKFREAMAYSHRSFRVAYYLARQLPHPHSNFTAILLPKDSSGNSHEVTDMFHKAEFFDLGNHLDDLAKQRMWDD